jgi:hypothetical protein
MAISPTPPGSSPAAATQSAPQGQGLRVLIWGGLIIGAAMMISLPTVMLVFFGLLPSIVAWMVDRSDQKYATFCVLGINFSGLFPYLMDIWFENHSIDAAIETMTNVFDLFVIYGSAAFGWMVYIALPPVITTFLSVMSERRLEILRETQKSIIEEWGENVASAIDPPDPINPMGPDGLPDQPPVQ